MLTRPALVFGLVIAVIGTLLRSITFYLSVERLPAGIMSVLISAVPLLAFPIALALRQVRVSTFASQSSYIVRVAGLVWTMAMLGESISPTIWAALVLMFAGLALVSPRERQPLFERS